MGNKIEIRNLYYKYRNQKKFVLNGISLSLPSKGVVGLFGRNGVGKTTLLRLIQGKYKPIKGNVWIDQQEPYRTFAARSTVHYIGDKMEVPVEWRVKEFLESYAYVSNGKTKRQNRKYIEEIWKKIPALEQLLTKYMWSLSRGQYNLVILATMLLTDSEIQ